MKEKFFSGKVGYHNKKILWPYFLFVSFIVAANRRDGASTGKTTHKQKRTQTHSTRPRHQQGHARGGANGAGVVRCVPLYYYYYYYYYFL